jgi:C4-dicarboxylate-specific signal transduction histidine kinase
MAKKHEHVEMTGLQFFGQISASISHEIKNVLAIINENAGLLEDLTVMADRGKPIDPARLVKMAATIKKQIGRADNIIKNMNGFAHSIDQTVTTVDLNEIVELIVALTARFAAMKNVEVDLQLPQDPLKIQTAPYRLLNLLWLCLDFAMDASGELKQIEVVAEETNDGIRIQLKRLTRLSEMVSNTFPSEREIQLLEILDAELRIEIEDEMIVLRFARSLD